MGHHENAATRIAELCVFIVLVSIVGRHRYVGV
mgnify:CR=1 FL=1